MLKICVEGWRGINHSFSIVNQNQLLELLKLPINLKIRDKEIIKFADKTNTILIFSKKRHFRH